MATSSNPQNHSHHLLLLTSIAVMISIFSMLGISYIRFLNSAKNKTPQNYGDCLKLKDSIITLSYPQICTTRDGRSFVQSTPSNSPSTVPLQLSDCCNQKELNQGYECLQGCGEPVAQENDPVPEYSCLNPTMAYSRKTFGCPICLASNTFISTPKGAIKVTDLKAGMSVWSVDKESNKISVPILRLSKTRVPQNHRVSHLVLSDGRKLDVSPNHPNTSGNPVSLLKPGDIYDKSVVLENSLLPYWDLFTYDLLPDSETGFYFANSILLKSTLTY